MNEMKGRKLDHFFRNVNNDDEKNMKKNDHQ